MFEEQILEHEKGKTEAKEKGKAEAKKEDNK